VISLHPLGGIPEIRAGDDLAGFVVDSAAEHAHGVCPGDVVVLSSKVLSKAIGLTRPGADRASVVAEESVRVVAERATATGVTRIVESAAGPVMAAAGVDASNTGPEHVLLVLPRDADAQAERLRTELRSIAGLGVHDPLGVIVTDTAGRPWRGGQIDFALGSAGIEALLDLRGSVDHDDRPLHVTAAAVADEIAAAADLVKGKASGIPAAIVRGVPAEWLAEHPARSAGSLVRRGAGDWFALGHVEAVRAALGVLPGSIDAAETGLPPVGAEPFGDRVARVLAVALRDTPGAGADIACGEESAELTLSAADPFTLGRLVARLEVAARGESLRTDLLGEATGTTLAVRLTPT
jgi:coenzyme F420-0:L-glutamate ligase/coenzyme F420-1:gamma-L-glutamate ligase